MAFSLLLNIFQDFQMFLKIFIMNQKQRGSYKKVNFYYNC